MKELKDLFQVGFIFYCNYSLDVHKYCTAVNQCHNDFILVSEKLQSLGEFQDLLFVLQQQSELHVKYSRLIKLIGGILDDCRLIKFLEDKTGKLMGDLDDYERLGLCNVTSMITDINRLISCLIVEIETDLNLPIAAINLIINSFINC